ncbi:MAG: enoyl-CoA hydratase [Sandaracinaceae bacterium]|nr:enoyl-CoA hydratase [Sandaracinaceae bacterium]
MKETTVQELTRAHVRELIINRPKVRNAFNNETYLALADALRRAGEDETVRVIFLRGEGAHFSAGQDLSEMSPAPKGEIGFERLLDQLVEAEKPIVTAVRGSAVGLGTTMLLHTDVNYFGDDAKLRCPFVPLGVVPEAGSSYLLVQRIGYQRTAEFLLTGRVMSAEEAVEAGLGIAVLPAEEVIDVARGVAERIAEGPPNSIRLTKKLLRAADRDQVAAARAREVEGFRMQLGSPENLEAIRAFFEKRPPRF